jgi:hypothetical protein
VTIGEFFTEARCYAHYIARTLSSMSFTKVRSKEVGQLELYGCLMRAVNAVENWTRKPICSHLIVDALLGLHR